MGILQQYWGALGDAKKRRSEKKKKEKGKKEEGKPLEEQEPGKNPFSFYGVGKDIQKIKARNKKILEDMEK